MNALSSSSSSSPSSAFGCLVAALVVGGAALPACGDGLVQPTSPAGTQIESLTVEDYCFRKEPVVTQVRGDKDLRRAAVLVDKHHVLDHKGIRQSAIYDGCRSSVVLRVGGETREAGVANCRDANVCPFLDEMHAIGLAPTRPHGCLADKACEPD